MTGKLNSGARDLRLMLAALVILVGVIGFGIRADNKAALAYEGVSALAPRVEANTVNMATTAEILSRVNTNLEVLNAWQLERVRAGAALEARVDALEKE